MYLQVVLVGDKEYDQGHVVKVLCKVIPGLGAMKAVAAFQEAQMKGKSIVLICDEVREERRGGEVRSLGDSSTRRGIGVGIGELGLGNWGWKGRLLPVGSPRACQA